MESIRFREWISNRKEKKTNLPRVVYKFRYFRSQKRYVSSLLLLFFFILLVDSFSQKFLKAFISSKQIDRANIFKSAGSRGDARHTTDGNRCEDFLILV